MDNRDRNKMNKEQSSSNRNTSNSGKVESGSDASFGKNIGRSENLENEPSRRSGSMDSSSGDRKSNLGEQSDIESSSSERKSSNESWIDKKNEH